MESFSLVFIHRSSSSFWVHMKSVSSLGHNHWLSKYFFTTTSFGAGTKMSETRSLSCRKSQSREASRPLVEVMWFPEPALPSPSTTVSAVPGRVGGWLFPTVGWLPGLSLDPGRPPESQMSGPGLTSVLLFDIRSSGYLELFNKEKPREPR